MKRIASITAVLLGAVIATPALAWGMPKHTHHCNCGDPIGKAMCGSSSSSSSTSSGGTTTSSSSGGTTTSSSSGGTTTSSSSGGTTKVPEPGMVGLMSMGVIAMAFARRRRAIG